MHIKIPVYNRFGPKVTIRNGNAYVKGPAGEITWAFNAKNITGKGIFVVACARSGTKYIVEILKRLGYDIGHERAGTDGSAGYHLAVIKPENCFLQVRHPIKQISSMRTQFYWGFMDHTVTLNNHALLGMMQYWLQWNELCEKFCVWRYRLEDLPNVWGEFLERIDHPYEPLPDVPTNINARKHDDFTWDDLFAKDRELAQKIYDKGIEYGYSFPSRGQNEAVEESQIAAKAV